jgi:hypothetical protein
MRERRPLLPGAVKEKNRRRERGGERRERDGEVEGER